VKDLSYSLPDIQSPSQHDEEIRKTRNIMDCFQSWDKYLNRAMLPDIAIGFDVCIFFDTTLILIANAMRESTVEGAKLLNNIRTTDPSLFYHTRPQKSNVMPTLMTNYKEDYQKLMKILGERFREGKLKSIIRIHLTLPVAVNARNVEVKKHQHVISKEYCNISWVNDSGIQEKETIPSLMVDVSRKTIRRSALFSQDLLKHLQEKTKEMQRTGDHKKKRKLDTSMLDVR